MGLLRIIGSHSVVNIRTLLDEVLSEWGIHTLTSLWLLSQTMVAAFKVHLEDVTGDSNDDDDDDDDDEEEEVEHEESEEITDILSMEEKDFLDCEGSEFIYYNRISCFSIHCSLL